MQPAPPPVPVLVNPGSGRAADSQALRDQFDGSISITVLEPAALYDAVSRAAATGAPIVGVAGGDGSMRTAAAALLHSQSALLCIPAGTINTFARRQGIPDIAAAAAALRARDIVAVSVGTFQDSCFLNTLTFGEYARIVRRRERYRRFMGKWPAAVLATVGTLTTLREMIVHLDVGGDVLIRRTPIVWVGLGWGSFPRLHETAERRSHPDLEVVVVRSATKRAAAATLLRLARGMLRRRMPLRDPQLEVLHARSLTLGRGATVSAHLPPDGAGDWLDATADGEVVRVRGPLRVGVLDGALRVIRGTVHGDAEAPTQDES